MNYHVQHRVILDLTGKAVFIILPIKYDNVIVSKTLGGMGSHEINSHLGISVTFDIVSPILIGEERRVIQILPIKTKSSK